MDWEATLETLREKAALPTSPAASTSNDCPLCGGLGYTAERREGKIFYSECPCAVKARNQRRIRRSGLEPLLEKCRLETFQTPERWQETAKAAAERYLTGWRGRWFFMGGNVGCGKTHLCTALSGALMEAGVDLRFFQWRSDATAIKALVNDADAYKAAIEPLKTVRALYIDDFLKGGATEADLRLAFDLLNARYNDPRTATILSSEKTIAQLLEWDEAVGSRIAERSRGFAVNIGGGGKNWRLRS